MADPTASTVTAAAFVSSSVHASTSSYSPSDGGDRVLLVPYRWWRGAWDLAGGEGPPAYGVPYAVETQGPSSYGMKLINCLFASALVFTLRKDEGSRDREAEAAPGAVLGGRSYALVPSGLWMEALSRHSDSSLTMKKNGSSSYTEDGTIDAYSLTLRISVMRETNNLIVKISKKDNPIEVYKRANKLFCMDNEPVHIWDFSEQTNLILMNEWNRWPHDCNQKSDQEIILEVHLYALSENLSSKRNDTLLQQANGGSLDSNDNLRTSISNFLPGSKKGTGLTGLENLGNTCFMNSAIQCLIHTPELVDFFLGDYCREINQENPLGMKGELALAFGDLLRKVWAVDNSSVSPRDFKSTLARFAPQFGGYNQHDSQELLAFLLDGLHEDLNRVRCKPYLESKDAEDRTAEEVAEEYWGNHLARNDSIIVDMCQGQYKSTLVCPVCTKVSFTFDPFMYLSLPLPSTMMRTMTVTVFSGHGSAKFSEYTISVPKSGQLKDLLHALSVACALGVDEDLLVAEVYAHRIIRFLELPSDSLSLIRDDDRLVAYRLPKNTSRGPLLVFVHQCMEESSSWTTFGVPLMTSLPSNVDGSNLKKLLQKLLEPFQTSQGDISVDNKNTHTSSAINVTEMEVDSSFSEGESTVETMEADAFVEEEFRFHLTDEKSQVLQCEVKMNESVSLSGLQKHLFVLVSWQNIALEQYDISRLNTLTEVHKFHSVPKRCQEPCSLYECLEAFLRDEPLGPEDMWYCPGCKKHQQASKKLDLWRLPEVLVVHLKRFSYNQYMKNKLGTLVDFPIHDLDLTKYIVGNSRKASNHYRLYAISNHYGNMGGGHYTAYVYHKEENRWYDFDDSNVRPIAENGIKTLAAYVLFYRRIYDS